MKKVPIGVVHLGVDLLTICSHKFHGPKGIGALYIRQGIKLEPLLYDAQHEQGLQPGTENVLAIVGLGKACQLISNKCLLNKRIEQMKRTRDRLYQGLLDQFHDSYKNLIVRNGNEEYCLPNTLSLSFHVRYSSLFTSILASLEENLSEDKYFELIRTIEQYFHVILSQSEIFYSSFIAALFNTTLYKSKYSITSLSGHLAIVDTSRSDRVFFAGNEPPESGHLRIMECGNFFRSRHSGKPL